MLLACFEKVKETHPPFRLLKVQHKMFQQANKQINYSTNLHRSLSCVLAPIQIRNVFFFCRYFLQRSHCPFPPISAVLSQSVELCFLS